MQPQHSLRLVDSTLREGEQFAAAAFTTDQRVEIARRLDALGVDLIEATSPIASPRAARDFERLAGLGLRARLAAHVRCRHDDVAAALERGADAIHVCLGTSPHLRRSGHGRDLSGILAMAAEVLGPLVEREVEVRFSCEDAFRTPARDVVRIAQLADSIGVDRIGLADTVGAATPTQVAERVGLVRSTVDCDIEFHGHNDGGCAVANAWAAYEAGATHLDTTVLGIGERNGIASLSGVVARAALSRDALIERLDLPRLVELDAYVADALAMDVPFNACITSPTAFTHKAGLHAKAVIAEPSSYESLEPADFGLTREVLLAHALVGRHAIAARAKELGLDLGACATTSLARRVKALADEGALDASTVDALIRASASPSTRPSDTAPVSNEDHA